MGIRKYKPTSAGRRGATVSDFADLTSGAKPEKRLLRPKKKNGGRNNQGKITVRHRGGGHKRRYRVIDFRRNKDGVAAKVASIQYDPNRSARIALLHYVDGENSHGTLPIKRMRFRSSSSQGARNRIMVRHEFFQSHKAMQYYVLP